jgi:hypothetical protein
MCEAFKRRHSTNEEPADMVMIITSRSIDVVNFCIIEHSTILVNYQILLDFSPNLYWHCIAIMCEHASNFPALFSESERYKKYDVECWSSSVIFNDFSTSALFNVVRLIRLVHKNYQVFLLIISKI